MGVAKAVGMVGQESRARRNAKVREGHAKLRMVGEFPSKFYDGCGVSDAEGYVEGAGWMAGAGGGAGIVVSLAGDDGAEALLG